MGGRGTESPPLVAGSPGAAGSAGSAGSGSDGGDKRKRRSQRQAESKARRSFNRCVAWLAKEYPELSSRWNGQVFVKKKVEMGNALASVNVVDNWAQIRTDINNDPTLREPTSLHEANHTISLGLGENPTIVDCLDNYHLTGWEEGVVESMTRLDREKMMRETGRGRWVDNRAWAVQDRMVYPEYMAAMREIEERLGIESPESKRAFYREMIGMSLEGRQGHVYRMGKEKFAGDPEAERRWDAAFDGINYDLTDGLEQTYYENPDDEE